MGICAYKRRVACSPSRCGTSGAQVGEKLYPLTRGGLYGALSAV